MQDQVVGISKAGQMLMTPSSCTYACSGSRVRYCKCTTILPKYKYDADFCIGVSLYTTQDDTKEAGGNFKAVEYMYVFMVLQTCVCKERVGRTLVRVTADGCAEKKVN